MERVPCSLKGASEPDRARWDECAPTLIKGKILLESSLIARELKEKIYESEEYVRVAHVEVGSEMFNSLLLRYSYSYWRFSFTHLGTCNQNLFLLSMYMYSMGSQPMGYTAVMGYFLYEHYDFELNWI